MIIVGTALYVRADAASLYANAAEGVTVSSVLSQVALSSPISIGSPMELNGTAVVGLSGEGPDPSGSDTVRETI